MFRVFPPVAEGSTPDLKTSTLHLIGEVVLVNELLWRRGHRPLWIGQGRSEIESAEFGKEVFDFEGVFSEGRGDIGGAEGSQDVQGHVADGGQDLRGGSRADLAGVLSHRGVPDPMHTVLDVPVLSPPLQQFLRGSQFRSALVSA